MTPSRLKDALGLTWEVMPWRDWASPEKRRDGAQICLFADELPSTQSALDDSLLASLPAPCQALALVTQHQSDGYGRLGRTWHCPKGAGLAFSVLLEISRDWSAGLWPLLVGWSKAQAISSFVPWRSLDLKWPNDLLLEGKKLSGSLCSFHQMRGRRWLKVGIGLNVGPMEFPEDLASSATTLAHHVEVQREVVLASILEVLMENIESLSCEELLKQYSMFSRICQNTPITWMEGEELCEGISRGLAPDGALVCERQGKTEALYVSEIHRLREKG